jgi:hypothetical protein
MTNEGVHLIAVERARQVEAEGFDAGRDDAYRAGELERGAAAYALNAGGVRAENMCLPNKEGVMVTVWPWKASWWKPGTSEHRRVLRTEKEAAAGRLEDEIRDLARAGALCAAAIDKRLRALGKKA